MLIVCLFTDDPDSECEVDGVKIDGSFLIVPWACILLLLSKCQRHGCAEQVLPSNVKVSRKGNVSIVIRQHNRGSNENVPKLEHFPKYSEYGKNVYVRG